MEYKVKVVIVFDDGKIDESTWDYFYEACMHIEKIANGDQPIPLSINLTRIKE